MEPAKSTEQVQASSTFVTGIQEEKTRLYQIWPGKNRFFLDGRIMLGPIRDNKAFIFTWVCLLGISAFFFVIAAPYVWYESSPGIPLAAGYFFVLTVIFSLMTTLTDPGIIPRKEILSKMGVKSETLIKDAKRMCRTCGINKPPRTSHCKHCDNCIEGMDHHCPFVNNCIGKNNYRYFITFLFHVVVLGILYIIGFLLHIIHESENIGHMTPRTLKDEEQITSLAIIVIALPVMILMFMVTMLCVFHVKICIKGETTKEVVNKLHFDDKVTCCWGSKTWFNPRMYI